MFYISWITSNETDYSCVWEIGFAFMNLHRPYANPSSLMFSLNRILLTCRQAFTYHTKWLHQVWGKMLLSAILYVLVVLDGPSDVLCACWCCWCSCWFLTFRPWVLNRPPSCMWVRLYLPMFLFRVRLFTIIKMDSFIVLARSSFPADNVGVVQFGGIVCGGMMVIYGWRRF